MRHGKPCVLGSCASFFLGGDVFLFGAGRAGGGDSFAVGSGGPGVGAQGAFSAGCGCGGRHRLRLPWRRSAGLGQLRLGRTWRRNTGAVLGLLCLGSLWQSLLLVRRRFGVAGDLAHYFIDSSVPVPIGKVR